MTIVYILLGAIFTLFLVLIVVVILRVRNKREESQLEYLSENYDVDEVNNQELVYTPTGFIEKQNLGNYYQANSAIFMQQAVNQAVNQAVQQAFQQNQLQQQNQNLGPAPVIDIPIPKSDDSEISIEDASGNVINGANSVNSTPAIPDDERTAEDVTNSIASSLKNITYGVPSNQSTAKSMGIEPPKEDNSDIINPDAIEVGGGISAQSAPNIPSAANAPLPSPMNGSIQNNNVGQSPFAEHVSTSAQENAPMPQNPGVSPFAEHTSNPAPIAPQEEAISIPESTSVQSVPVEEGESIDITAQNGPSTISMPSVAFAALSAPVVESTPQVVEQPLVQEQVVAQPEVAPAQAAEAQQQVVEQSVIQEQVVAQPEVTPAPVAEAQQQVVEQSVEKEQVVQPEVTPAPVVEVQPQVVEQSVEKEQVVQPEVTPAQVVEVQPQVVEQPVVQEQVVQPEVTPAQVVEVQPQVVEQPVAQEQVIVQPEITSAQVVEAQPQVVEQPVVQEQVVQPEVTSAPVVEVQPQVVEQPVAQEQVIVQPEVAPAPVVEVQPQVVEAAPVVQMPTPPAGEEIVVQDAAENVPTETGEAAVALEPAPQPVVPAPVSPAMMTPPIGGPNVHETAFHATTDGNTTINRDFKYESPKKPFVSYKTEVLDITEIKRLLEDEKNKRI